MQVEVAPAAVEVLVELAAHIVERRAQDADAERARERLVAAVDGVRDAAEAARRRRQQQVADRRVDDVVADVHEPARQARPRGSAVSRSGLTLKVPPQSADAGRRCGAGRVLGRAERVADRGIGQVVAVTEHDRGTLGRRQRPGQVLELEVRGLPQLRRGRLAAPSSSSDELSLAFDRSSSMATRVAIVKTHARR